MDRMVCQKDLFARGERISIESDGCAGGKIMTQIDE
jgi:hypothetical protein